MFTGIVQDIGSIAAIERGDGDLRLSIATRALSLDAVRVGDSICVAGVCLTVAELGPRRFAADVSRETLSVTTLGSLAIGAKVNLEAALTAAQPLGGHLMAGHVDGVAELLERGADARSRRLDFRAPAGLSRYVARKGSVAIDGVSLTINDVSRDVFSVNIIPQTLQATTLGALAVGDRANLEVDLLARYVERLLTTRSLP